jgi:hypothetical protein
MTKKAVAKTIALAASAVSVAALFYVKVVKIKDA